MESRQRFRARVGEGVGPAGCGGVLGDLGFRVLGFGGFGGFRV